MDKPFLLNYTMQVTPGKPSPNKWHKNGYSFTALFSTKRLLFNGVNSKIIHADATHKVLWHNFPLLVFGITDKSRAFHPISIALSSNEKTEAFRFAFHTINESVWAVHNRRTIFEILMADSCEAIRRGFLATYPNGKIGMCWYHVKKNVEEKLKGSAEKMAILDDMTQLQLSPSEDVFDCMSNLFLEKWTPMKPQFTAYFQKTWLKDSNRNWFEGYAHCSPSTNNALEATNNRIKNDFDFREKVMVAVFKQRFSDMLSIMSREYRDGVKVVKEIVLWKKSMWLKGAKWAEGPKIPKTVRDTAQDISHYYITDSVSDLNVVSTADYKQYTQSNFDSFDAMKAVYSTVWRVTLPHDKDLVNVVAKCTCPVFLKNYICHHIIGLALRLHLIEMPDDYALIEPARKRGRAKKRGPALSRT